MADDMEAVTQRFEADVDEYVTEVQAAADEAKRFADAALEAKAGADELRNGAAEAAPAVGHLRDELAEAAAALKVTRDEAGKFRDASGEVVTAAELQALALKHVRDQALEAAWAQRDLNKYQKDGVLSRMGGGLSGLLGGGEGGGGGLGGIPMIGPLLANPAALVAALAGVMALVTEGGALVTALSAAALGVGSFAALAIPAFTQVTGALGDTKKKLDKLPEPIQLAVGQVKSLENGFKAMSKAFEPTAFKVMNEGLGVAKELLPYLGQFATAAAPAIEGVIGMLSSGLKSDQFGGLMALLVQMSGPVITAVGSGLKGLATDVATLMERFSTKDAVNSVNIAFRLLGATISLLTGIIIESQMAWDFITQQALPAVRKALDLTRHDFATAGHDIASTFDTVRHGIATDGHMIAATFDDVRHSAATLAHDIAAHFDEVRHDIAQWAGDVRQDVANFPGLLVSAGAALVDGLIHGIESKADQLRSEVAHLGSDVVGWAKDALGIASPSKEFAALGEQITAGLTLGINSTKQQAIEESRFLAEQVALAFEYGVITKSQDASLRKKLATALTTALKGGVQDAFGSGTIKQIGESAQKLLQTIWDTEKGGLLGRTQASQFAGWVKADNATLQSLAVQRNAIAKEIAAAQALARGTASAAESTFDLSSASTTAAGGQAKPGGIIANLKADVSKIRNFSWALRKLAKEGLNKAYLSQLISLGPDAGGAIAGELAGAGLGDIKSINAAESAITYESNQLGANAVSAMYTAGKESGAGFLQGLKDQKKAIETLMSQIAAGVIAALRKDLGIASPSRVMYGHGVDTLQGYINGVKSMQPQLQALMRSIGGGVALGGVGGVAAAGGGGGGAAPHFAVSVTANLAPGMQAYQTPAFQQFLQKAVQEAFARWSLSNPGTGFGIPGRS